MSVALVLEYEAVLNRAAMREASWASKEELDVVLDALIGQARRIADQDQAAPDAR